MTWHLPTDWPYEWWHGPLLVVLVTWTVLVVAHILDRRGRTFERRSGERDRDYADRLNVDVERDWDNAVRQVVVILKVALVVVVLSIAALVIEFSATSWPLWKGPLIVVVAVWVVLEMARASDRRGG